MFHCCSQNLKAGASSISQMGAVGLGAAVPAEPGLPPSGAVPPCGWAGSASCRLREPGGQWGHQSPSPRLGRKH